ncbi:MAG TPA: PIG-L family deacetylase, partial [Bacteroidota bacterium]|nr:PIG-L family deacetylase [Bacteroidota bacterium]
MPFLYIMHGGGLPRRLVVGFLLPILVVCAICTSAWGAGDDGQKLAEHIGLPLNVLYIALQPGYEDLRVVAYYSLMHGSRVRVAFVTNGEAGEHDHRSMYPHELAATHRLEAAATLERFNAEVYFLNMPDVVSASDSLVVRSFWAAESLQARCRALIMEFLPDVILLAGDRESDDPLRLNIVHSDVLAAVRDVARDSVAPWKVSRVALESTSRNAVVIPIDRRTKSGEPTARSLADSRGSLYTSMSVQRMRWTQSMTPSFSVVHPPTFTGKVLEAGIPGNLPASVR